MNYEIDLFGNERPAQAGPETAIVLNLFDAAAETAALASGRPKSQERAEITSPLDR